MCFSAGESGTASESQITAFEDTWYWHTGGTAATYNELINEPDQVGRMIESFYQFIGKNQMMAYLVMRAARLKELHRVLKPTGSLYLHCDPTTSHYLKIFVVKSGELVYFHFRYIRILSRTISDNTWNMSIERNRSIMSSVLGLNSVWIKERR